MKTIIKPEIDFIAALLLFAVSFMACREEKRSYEEWKVTGGSKEGIRYSTLQQITPANVNRLTVAWEYHTGDADTVNHSQMQCNPIVVDGVLYATSPRLKLIAVNAETGKEKWVFDPADPGQTYSRTDFIMNNNRGVTYWSDGKDERVFYVVGSTLYSVDARDGKLVRAFGKEGKVDLHDDLGRDVTNLFITATSPGIIYQDRLIIGTRVSEGTDAAPGHIRAYNVRSGKMEWIFHTIPHPGEFGHDTWADPTAYEFIGGANSWAGFTLDEKRGILFAPTGSASFDFYGGKRRGATLFANCLLALDAKTGERKWHYQYIHHDIWDRDLPTAPALVTVTRDGTRVDAVAQPTKTGYVFLFDRETGKPLFEIREEPVPAISPVEGEELSPTQPVPVLPEPFSRQTFAESDLNDLVPDSSYQDLKKRYSTYRKGHVFAPLSKEGTVVFPGLDGGAEWGGPAFDPETGILYVNANEMPWVITLTETDRVSTDAQTNLDAGISLYKRNCMGCHGANLEGGGNYPSLKGSASKYDVEQFKKLVTTGRRMMPGFAHLSDEERHAIAVYVLDLENEQGEKFIGNKQKDQARLPYTITGYNKFLSKENYPAIKPPWGTLSAVNLNTGKLEWRVPLGEDQYFKKKGIITGTENYGGPVVTASGLLFIAATPDSKLRAFDKTTGKVIWETTLPAPAFATPAMYLLNGKQYLVVTCGGGKLGTRSGDSYVAFSLP